MVDAPELLRRHAHVEGEQDVGLEPADALDHQGRDVPVAAVLAEQGSRVEQPRHGLVGHRQGPERGVHRPAVGRGTDGCPRQQFSGAGEGRRVDAITEDAAQRVDAALLPSGEGGLGGGRVPDLRDVAGHLAGREVVEECVHDLGRHVAPSGAARPAK